MSIIEHEWPTGCLVFDTDEQGDPVNVRNIEVVPLAVAERLYDAETPEEKEEARDYFDVLCGREQ